MKQLDQKGFNEWAKNYNLSVEQSEKENRYPFAGYTLLLEYVRYYLGDARTALDIGIGTGKLWNFEIEVTGIDFSSEMLDIARGRLPNAKLYKHDLLEGLPAGLKKYDAVVSTYAIHHFEDDYKVKIINECMKHLNPGGIVLIGDVSFDSLKDLESCRLKHVEEWDDSEFYFVAEEIIDKIPYNTTYIKVSDCAGLLVIRGE